MNTLFDTDLTKQIIERINHLSAARQGQWGKMSVSQMLAHCSATLVSAIGDKKEKREFLGLLFGKIAKKQVMKDEPFKKNMPTAKLFKMTDDKNFDEEKKRLVSLIKKFAELGTGGVGKFPHPFFGEMDAQERGVLQWKHLDHHLKQFGA